MLPQLILIDAWCNKIASAETHAVRLKAQNPQHCDTRICPDSVWWSTHTVGRMSCTVWHYPSTCTIVEQATQHIIVRVSGAAKDNKHSTLNFMVTDQT
jgi:hypothetical protein